MKGIKNRLSGIARALSSKCSGDSEPASMPPYQLQHTYTVVTATYNSERYLDAYFESFAKQTAALDKVKLLVIDDGSTDGTAEVVEKWKKSYPGFIEYVYRENGGQAGARNMGIDLVDTEWVTFTDSDDFVSSNYLECVDKAICAHPDLQMVVCNCIYYFEDTDTYADVSPSRYRFKKRERYFAYDDDEKPLHLGMASAFFRSTEIERQSLRIDEGIRPNFEDGHFVSKYMLDLASGSIGYLRAPKYYYRKRGDGSSTLNHSWENVDKLLVVTKNGYLDLMQYAQQTKGYVPVFIQNTVLYDLSWHFKRFTDHPERSDVFGSDVAYEYWGILEQIFAFIEEDSILKIRPSWYGFNKRIALLRRFKGRDEVVRGKLTAYVEAVDPEVGVLQIDSIDRDISLLCDGQLVEPIEAQSQEHCFFGREFYTTYRLFFPLAADCQSISYTHGDGLRMRLKAAGSSFWDAAPVQQLVELLADEE